MRTSLLPWMASLAGAAGPLGAQLQSCGAPAFALGSHKVAGNNPRMVATGDLDDDGNVDMVVPNMGSGDVTVMLGQGDGKFVFAPSPSVGPGPRTADLGDLNGDGFVDLVTASQAGNVSVLLGFGDGTFAPAPSLSVSNLPEALVIAPLNADGNLDLAIMGNDLPIFFGAGDGTPSDCSGIYDFDFNAWIQSGQDPLLMPGDQVNGQFWSRDPAHPDGTGSGLGDAIEFVPCP